MAKTAQSKNVAYMRVSTTEQSLASQQDALAHVKFDLVYTEKMSGLDQDRPQLKECLKHLRAGDVLFVTRADRLARSTSHLLKIVEDLKEEGVDVVFTQQSELSTNTPQGKLMLSILAAIAEFETALRGERQAEGIAAAKARGVRFGPKPKLTEETVKRIRALRADGMSIGGIQVLTGIKSKTTVYKALRVPRNSAMDGQVAREELTKQAEELGWGY